MQAIGEELKIDPALLSKENLMAAPHTDIGNDVGV